MWHPAWWGWLALVAVYGASSIVAALSVARHSGFELLWLMPLVFACYHIGYGAGFIAGVGGMLWPGRSPLKLSQTITRSN
jgi:hypothetical protein